MPLKAIFRTGGSFPVLKLLRLTLQPINTSMPLKISIRIQFDAYNTIKFITSSLSTAFSIFRTGALVPVLKLIGLNLQTSNSSMPVKISIHIQFDTYNTMKLITSS